MKKNSPPLPPYLQESAEGCILKVLLRPRSHAERIEAPQGDALKISVTAPPVEGKANDALLRFLADQLGLRRSQLSIQAGHRSVRKLIGITGASTQQVLERLNPSKK